MTDEQIKKLNGIFGKEVFLKLSADPALEAAFENALEEGTLGLHTVGAVGFREFRNFDGVDEIWSNESIPITAEPATPKIGDYVTGSPIGLDQSRQGLLTNIQIPGPIYLLEGQLGFYYCDQVVVVPDKEVFSPSTKEHIRRVRSSLGLTESDDRRRALKT